MLYYRGHTSPADAADAKPDDMDTDSKELMVSIKGQLLQGLSDDAEEIRYVSK